MPVLATLCCQKFRVLIGARDQVAYSALVDTGADDVVFPRSVADELGIALSQTNTDGTATTHFSPNHFSPSAVNALCAEEGQGIRVSGFDFRIGG